MFNWPLVYKTYQDVKNNLAYWTLLLLFASTAIVYGLFLDQPQRTAIINFITSLGTNALLATFIAAISLAVYATVTFILIHGAQIHDVIYDRYIIRWRERYDIEFILPKLIESFKKELPGNFADYARRYRDKFMNPYYDFVGDGKKGIEENTRIRFYERITWYWISQVNEIFILAFLLITPVFVLLAPGGSFNTDKLAGFFLTLVLLGLFNRWLIRISLRATSQATLEEINEILAKQENVQKLRKEYIKLCKENRL